MNVFLKAKGFNNRDLCCVTLTIPPWVINWLIRAVRAKCCLVWMHILFFFTRQEKNNNNMAVPDICFNLWITGDGSLRDVQFLKLSLKVTHSDENCKAQIIQNSIWTMKKKILPSRNILNKGGLCYVAIDHIVRQMGKGPNSEHPIFFTYPQNWPDSGLIGVFIRFEACPIQKSDADFLKK